ncbi:hypothetical protein F2Q69_00040224 [Brassica cretica]|uniref:Uncharacterized protein n=1 Tax=Brassica cretica TaxID=69181 RepID=A0A8S9NSQ4_BRACR|nr:hypothetical protein F2Q69_00040224 [Brassica cretica]
MPFSLNRVLMENGITISLIATGLATTCFPSDHSMLPKLLDPDGFDESTVNVTEYNFFSFTSLKIKSGGSTEILTAVTVRVYLYVSDPSTLTANDGKFR